MFTYDATASRADEIRNGSRFTTAEIKQGKKFRTHERQITQGEFTALLGWWNAALDARAMFGDGYGVASAYAKLVAKVATDNTENTIRQYVGACLTAMDTINKNTGKKFVARDFKGIGHLRATVKSDKKGNKPEKFRNPTRKVTAPTRKAYEALIATAEFKALPANERKIIKMLMNGESFSTATL